MCVKRLIIVFLSTVACLSTSAYNDYRNARVDSLEAALASKNPPKGADLLSAYDELMRGYLPFDSLKATDYGRKALALSYELDGLNVRQNVLRRFAQMHYAREEFDAAIALYQQALTVVDTMTTLKRYTEKDIDDAHSAIYGNMANTYNLQDKGHLAIHYYQLALKIFEKYNWLESQSILYYNIGELYSMMGNEAEALRNYLLAVEKGKASGDSLMVASPQKGLTRLYTKQGNYDKARQTAEQCYAYYYAHRDNEEDYPVMLAAMVRLNLMEGHENLAAAKAYAKEALGLTDGLAYENKREIYLACCQLAMAEKQWQQALDYGLQTIGDSVITSGDAGCYQLLAEIYTELGQKEKARECIQKMYDVMTRYATDHYQSGLSQMEVLYETEKKEAQIAALDKESSLYRWLLVAAVIAIAALVAGTILIVIVQRRKKALLAAKVALETETKERRILARDLHDGLGGMLSVLRLKTEQGEATLPLIDSIHTELRRTAHHLMPEELLRNGLVSALRDFAVSVPSARFQAIGDIHLSKNQELVLYRCAYELVNNALKHAEATHIDIQLMQDEKEITLTVSDNGKGMAEGNCGMGLQNIRERIEPYHGSLNIVTADGKGTDINITLPL